MSQLARKKNFRKTQVRCQAAAYSISWNEAQFATVFEKDAASILLGVDADAIVGDDGRRGGVDFELFGDVFDDGGKGRGARHLDYTKWQFGVGREHNFKLDFGHFVRYRDYLCTQYPQHCFHFMSSTDEDSEAKYAVNEKNYL